MGFQNADEEKYSVYLALSSDIIPYNCDWNYFPWPIFTASNSDLIKATTEAFINHT